MNAQHLKLLRYSLAAVWLLTALVSLMEWRGQSLQLLQAGGITSSTLSNWLIALGAAVDAVLGFCLLLYPRRWVYAMCLLMTLAMTAVATILLPDLWLHPLGPLLKNVPILAILWVLMHENRNE